SSDNEGAQPPPLGAEQLTSGSQYLATATWQPPAHFVGRQQELTQLHRWFAAARAGRRQLAFVRGEAGIGKTALLQTFLHQIHQTGPVWVLHGQCVEQYGGTIAYLPLLDALGQWRREPDAAPLVPLFEQVAPLWLAQAPARWARGQCN